MSISLRALLPALRRRWPWVVAALVLLFIASRVPGWLFGPAVEAYRVEARPLLANVVATGRVETPSRVTVGSEITGTVVERPVREGDRLAAGDVVARLSDDDERAKLEEARATLAQLLERERPVDAATLVQARGAAEQARRDAARFAELATKGLVARDRAEQAAQARRVADAALAGAEAQARASGPGGSTERLLRDRVATAEAALAQTVIRTRVAGTVLRRLAEPGDVVQAGRGIVELAREGDLLVVAQVDERNLDRLAEGQSALVSADAFPSQRLPARVVFIAPAVHPQTGTVEVRVEVPEPPATLRQDMTVSIDIEVGRRERALVLPIDAVDASDSAGPSTVLVVREGRVQRVPVTLGLRGVDRVEVLEGLTEGEAVLPLAGAPADGARVRVAAAE